MSIIANNIFKMNITEQSSRYDNLEEMTTHQLLLNINNEDKGVPSIVKGCIPQIERLVDEIVIRMKNGGRLFYIGAGTSGRLGVIDASEIPPTFGAPDNLVVGIIAGGDRAIRKAVEAAEDDIAGGWRDILAFNPQKNDVVLGLAASGSTPYVIGAVREARKGGLLTSCITCNPCTPLAEEVDIPIVAIVGPEFVSGSTRMKSGTAQKLILNMISTSVMVLLGHIKGNKMIDMQLTNSKLIDRGARMIMSEGGIEDYKYAKKLLIEHHSVRNALEWYNKNRGL